LTDASDRAPAATAARTRPAVTSSQRHTITSSPGSAGRSAAYSRHNAPWNARARRHARSDGTSDATRSPSSRAASSPAIRPCASAAIAPPSAAPSPTTNSPSTLVRPAALRTVSSTPEADTRCSAPSARANPVSGTNPTFSAHTSAAIRRTPFGVATARRSNRSSPSHPSSRLLHSTGTPARRSRARCRNPASARNGAATPSRATSTPGFGRAAASTTAATFAPPSSSSHATCSSSGPLPASTTRCPGETRCERTSPCTAPTVITPGKVQPAIGTGRSCAPGARISRRGRNNTAAPSTIAAISSRANPPHTSAPDQIATQDAACARNASPRLCCRSSRCGCRTPCALKYCPPGRARSSSSTVRAPLWAAAAAAASPAGPPPTTSTSQASSRCGTAARMGGKAAVPLSTTTPARAAAMHARAGAPSIVTRQSQHAPMPHHSPRRDPSASRRNATASPAASADATVSPGTAATARPSNVNEKAPCAALPESSIPAASRAAPRAASKLWTTCRWFGTAGPCAS